MYYYGLPGTRGGLSSTARIVAHEYGHFSKDAQTNFPDNEYEASKFAQRILDF